MSAILCNFSSSYFQKRNASRHVVTSLRSCDSSRAKHFYCKWCECVVLYCRCCYICIYIYIIYIYIYCQFNSKFRAMAEFEPYSFEPMRNNSSSEDEASVVGEPRRANTTWCSWDLCTNWECQQERECLCCQEIDEAVNKISGEYFLFKR